MNNPWLAIEKKADKVRENCNVTDYGVHNIFEVAEKLGYRVIRYPIGDAFLGFSMLKDSERIIFSNSSSILSREIFTVAHEIGHQQLHLSETGRTLIRDDNFDERDECEVEANYFAACLLMPADKVKKFIRLELNGKEANKWNGFEIARIQTAFNVSYDMALVRLKALGLLDEDQFEKLQLEKIEKTATKLLKAINGNVDLCTATEVKTVPAEYLEWAISNYKEKLIPKSSLAAALKYVDLDVDDFVEPIAEEEEDDNDIEDLLREME